MADNVLLNSGSGGETMATDDDGTAHHQYVKIEFGADNTQTKVASGAGLPVTPDSGGFDITNAGTFVVQEDGAALTALQLIDDIVYVDDADWIDGTSKHALIGGLYQSTPQSITDGDVGPLQVDSSGNIKISNANHISSVNSSTATLAGDAVFTGTSEDISLHSSVSIQTYASHASATDGLSMEFSTDGTNWDEKHVASIAAATEREFIFPTHANYFRIVYTNGSTQQTAFRLQTILHIQALAGSSHTLDMNVPADAVGALGKSVILAQAAGSG